MKHDVEIQEIEVDSQTTAWVMYCKRCKKKSKPVYRRDDAEACINEDSCDGID